MLVLGGTMTLADAGKLAEDLGKTFNVGWRAGKITTSINVLEARERQGLRHQDIVLYYIEGDGKSIRAWRAPSITAQMTKSELRELNEALMKSLVRLPIRCIG